jgi:hypothetical protein
MQLGDWRLEFDPALQQSREGQAGHRVYRLCGRREPRDAAAPLPSDPRRPPPAAPAADLMLRAPQWRWDENSVARASDQRAVCVRNLPPRADTPLLGEEFGSYGEVELVTVYRHATTEEPSGVATVRYRRVRDAKRAVEMRNERTLFGARISVALDGDGAIAKKAFGEWSLAADSRLQADKSKRLKEAQAAPTPMPDSSSSESGEDRGNGEEGEVPAALLLKRAPPTASQQRNPPPFLRRHSHRVGGHVRCRARRRHRRRRRRRVRRRPHRRRARRRARPRRRRARGDAHRRIRATAARARRRAAAAAARALTRRAATARARPRTRRAHSLSTNSRCSRRRRSHSNRLIAARFRCVCTS